MKPTIASTAAESLPTERRTDQGEDRDGPRRRRAPRTGRENESRYLRTGARTDRKDWTLEVAAREYIWLYDRGLGLSYEEIAAREGVTVGRVRYGVKRAKEHESKLSKDDLIEDLKPGRTGDPGFRLIPLFPIGAFTPQAPCPHHGSIGRGSRLCCMVCHASGMDDHPGLRRDPEADPEPEPEPAPASDCAKPSRPERLRETRKQRRARLSAAVAAVA